MRTLSSCLKNQQNSTCIRATGMEITIIDILPASKYKCTSLSLSFNNISDLSNLKQFNLLTVLHLESNCIERISELGPLLQLPHLKNLSLSGNKVCNLPLFKAHIISICPKIQILDGKSVSSFIIGNNSREKFNKFLYQEKKCFKSIYINNYVVQVLKSKKKNHDLTQEFLNSYIKPQNYQNMIHDLRLKSLNLPPSSYFKFLKQTLIVLYHFVFKTGTLLELEKKLLSRFSIILKSLEQPSHFSTFLEKAKKLDNLALRLINLTENSFDENIFNEFQISLNSLSNQKKEIIRRIKSTSTLSSSSDSISSQFCNSDEFYNKSQSQNKIRLHSSAKSNKKMLFISSDDNDSASLSNDSNSHAFQSKKPFKNAKRNEANASPIHKQNNLSSDFEFSSDPLKISSSSNNISLNNKSRKSKDLIFAEEPASEETLPKYQQSVSSELGGINRHDDAYKSNLFLTELASEEIISKSQQSFSEVDPITLKALNIIPQITKNDQNLKFDSHKNSSTEIEADEIFDKEKKNGNNDMHIHFLINQSISPELASDEITQNTQSNQSDSITQKSISTNNDGSSSHQIIISEESNKNIHFPTSQIELASDEANQDSEAQTNSEILIPSLSIEAASSSSNKDNNLDQLSEGNENSNLKISNSTNIKTYQISTSLELASDETLPHSSIIRQQTSESDLQNANLAEYKRKNKDENDHTHNLKLPQSASLEFASDETLSNTQKSSSAFEDSDSEESLMSKNPNTKKSQIKNKIHNKNIHKKNISKQDYQGTFAKSNKKSNIIIEEELASEEGQNEEHVSFDSKVRKIRLDASKEKHLKASQESFSLDEMASGETLPSAKSLFSDDDSEFEL